jgi:hypothetical protein
MGSPRFLPTLALATALVMALVTAHAADPPPPVKPASPAKPIAPPPHALYGVGAHPCSKLVEVAGESDGNQIALTGAMFSWAQGWFSARNLVGHENAPLTVGGTMSSEALKAMLVTECKGHPDESIYLAVNDLYERLARKGL